MSDWEIVNEELIDPKDAYEMTRTGIIKSMNRNIQKGSDNGQIYTYYSFDGVSTRQDLIEEAVETVKNKGYIITRNGPNHIKINWDWVNKPEN